MADFPDVRPRTKSYSCFQCKYFHPDLTQQYLGQCARHSVEPAAAQDAPYPGGEWVDMWDPGLTWCGEYERWEGPERECGTPTQPVLLKAITDTDAAILEITDKNAARVLDKKDPLKADVEKLAELQETRKEAVQKYIISRGGK